MNFICDEDPIVAAFIWALAAWTILCHAAVASGGSFSQLILFAPIALIVAGIGWYFRPRSAQSIETDEHEWVGKATWLVSAGLILLTYRLGFFWFWLAALVFLIAGWVWVTFSPSPFNAVPKGPSDSHLPRHLARPFEHGDKRGWNTLGLVILCSSCVFITLLLHQPDIDDGFYISVAADAHRHPQRAIWSTDTIHDDANRPVFLPIYKAESYEYLIALVAGVLHISSVRAAHTALPITFAIFVALAWALIARTIDPKRWFAIAAVGVVISIFAGATKSSPANYAFTRLQQGKAVMVSAVVPILCVYAFRLMTFGSWKHALLLTAAQVAGVGLSSTSIVIGPAVVCAVGFCCLAMQKRRSLIDREVPDPEPNCPVLRGKSETGILTRWLLILAACIYPISIALLMRHQMLGVSWLAETPAQPAAYVLTNILGDRAQLWFFLATLVVAWAVVPRRVQQLLLGPCILLLAVMINPLITHLLQTSVFTPNTYWRGLWVVPWMIWSAVFICGLSSWVGSIAGLEQPWLSRAIALVFGSAVLLILLGRHPIWRQQNGTTVHFGALAVDQPEYTVAERLAADTPTGFTALAPEHIACWTAVLDQRPPLIFVRSFYTQSTPDAGGINDVRFRNRLGEIAGKTTLNADDVKSLLIGIDRYRLGAIVLTKTAGTTVGGALIRKGFVEQLTGKYSIWIRRGV